MFTDDLQLGASKWEESWYVTCSHGTKVPRNINMERLRNGYLFSEVSGF
ncbi:hypothetical protein CK203_022038 [Vitis vinifera]|uniref:Uncharacterized protein n=1 Tax=Vitis vinifera TaxID=29760 RepID=A0A438FZX4_VITVI|nr:hypothetical protein CK203_022038 [Vitis vinifera]